MSAAHCADRTNWSACSPVTVTVTTMPSVSPALGDRLTAGPPACARPAGSAGAATAAVAAPVRAAATVIAAVVAAVTAARSRQTRPRAPMVPSPGALCPKTG